MVSRISRLKRGYVFVVLLLLFFPLAVQAAEEKTKRILMVGDSWAMLIATNPLDIALANHSITDAGWLCQGTVIGGSGIEDWAEGEGDAEGALERVVEQLNLHPTIDIVFITIGFDIIFRALLLYDPPIPFEEYEALEPAVLEEAKYGADGEHGLKLIFDTILDVRPDIRVLFASYDYIGWLEEDWDMDMVQWFNVRMERLSGAVIDLIDEEYKSPPRVFLVNNMGLTQYTFGYPGPGTIPDYFWPQPGDPHPFRFDPGPPAIPGDPPLFPGNEASGYVPLAAGDPDFRISPYAAQLDPPFSGWVHLSSEGYLAYAEHCIDEYIADWLGFPKVYAVKRATRSPLDQTLIEGPIGLDQLTFEVTFSETVSGVDVADFDVIMGGGVANASVESVEEGKDGATYTVVVNTGAGDGTLGLAVLDNDSIVDGDLNPLGGAGANNGFFAYGEDYEIDRSVTLPVAAWPVALVLLGIGVSVLRRVRRRRTP